MDESALEHFFDKFIANDSSRINEEDEDDYGEESFFRLLPDELLTVHKPDQNNTVLADSSTSLDHNYHNPSHRSSSVTPESHKISGFHFRPVLHNVVSSVNLGCCLDLKLIASKAWNTEYKPKVFSAAIMRMRRPRATANIFTSGNLVCTGAKSMKKSKVAARKFARIMQKLGFPVRFINFKIHLLVATCSTFPVSLEKLVLAQSEHCSYEPELFPCAFYKMQPGHCMAITSKGNVTLSGPNNLADLYRGFELIYPILNSVRKTNCEEDEEETTNNK